MDSGSKRVSKWVWVLMIGFLVVMIGLLIVRFWGFNNSSSQSVLEEEQSDIVLVLDVYLSKYSPGIEYKVKDVRLIAEDYAVAVLGVSGVTYRVLLTFDEGWSVMGYPRVVLSYIDFPDVPKDIIRSANGVGR